MLAHAAQLAPHIYMNQEHLTDLWVFSLHVLIDRWMKDSPELRPLWIRPPPDRPADPRGWADR